MANGISFELGPSLFRKSHGQWHFVEAERDGTFDGSHLVGAVANGILLELGPSLFRKSHSEWHFVEAKCDGTADGNRYS